MRDVALPSPHPSWADLVVETLRFGAQVAGLAVVYGALGSVGVVIWSIAR